MALRSVSPVTELHQPWLMEVGDYMVAMVTTPLSHFVPQPYALGRLKMADEIIAMQEGGK